MTKREWKEGDRCVIYRRVGSARDEIVGTIHRFADIPDRWWFIPEGGRIMDGLPVTEAELWPEYPWLPGVER